MKDFSDNNYQWMWMSEISITKTNLKYASFLFFNGHFSLSLLFRIFTVIDKLFLYSYSALFWVLIKSFRGVLQNQIVVRNRIENGKIQLEGLHFRIIDLNIGLIFETEFESVLCVTETDLSVYNHRDCRWRWGDIWFIAQRPLVAAFGRKPQCRCKLEHKCDGQSI